MDMPFPVDAEKFLWEGICFLTFLILCGGLAVPRLPRRLSLLAGGGAAAAIVLLQAALLLAGQDASFVLTMLPLTAYLPAVVCLHLLSRSGFFQTMAVWTVGAVAVLVLRLLRKLTVRVLAGTAGLSAPELNAVTAAVLLLAAAGLSALALRTLREPFRAYVLQSRGSWLLLSFPVLMMALLFTYFMDSTTEPAVLLLLLLAAGAIFLVVVRVLASAAQLTRAEAGRRAVALQLERQREEYDRLRQRLEQGRTYRHDMRHHLAALTGLARQENAAAVLSYLEELGVRLDETELPAYCGDAAVNAVLASCLRQAREAGCLVEAEVKLPSSLPFDSSDLCVVLANVLENAVQACRSLPREERRLRLSVRMAGGRLNLSVDNPCPVPPSFGGDGLPRSGRGAGHGLGLRSVRAVAVKYGGLLQCWCGEGEFRLRTVLFAPSAPAEPASAPRPVSRPSPGRTAAAAVLSLFTVFLCLGCMPALADALAGVPGLGQVTRLADVRTYTAALGWGDTGIQVQLPADGPEGSLRGETEDFLADMEETFLRYASRKYDGYVGMDVTYRILWEDGALLTVRYDGVLNAGGSGQYSRCLTLDKETGEVLTLSDLFLPGSDYVAAISGEILAQMTAQVEAGLADYFIPGGIWSEEECFREIDPDQNFYLTPQRQLIIVFDEYQVAPGSMGMPEFAIPSGCLAGLPAPGSPLAADREGGES